MSKQSACIFEWDADDLAALRAAKVDELANIRAIVLSDAEVNRRLSMKELALHCQRHTRGVSETTRLLQQLITELDGDKGRDTMGVPLLDQVKVQKAVETPMTVSDEQQNNGLAVLWSGDVSLYLFARIYLSMCSFCQFVVITCMILLKVSWYWYCNDDDQNVGHAKGIWADQKLQEELYCEAATDIIPSFQTTDAAAISWFRPAHHHDWTSKEPGYKMVQKSQYCLLPCYGDIRCSLDDCESMSSSLIITSWQTMPSKSNWNHISVSTKHRNVTLFLIVQYTCTDGFSFWVLPYVVQELLISSDDEQAMRKALFHCFHRATMVACQRHLKKRSSLRSGCRRHVRHRVHGNYRYCSIISSNRSSNNQMISISLTFTGLRRECRELAAVLVNYTYRRAARCAAQGPTGTEWCHYCAGGCVSDFW